MESAKRTSSPPIKKQKTESEVQQDTTKSPGIYTQLPQHILGKTLPSTDGAEYVNSVIRQATSSKHSNDNKQLIYMNNISKPKTSEDELKEHEQRIQSRKSIRSKEKRLKKLFMIPEDKRAYCNHNPLTHVTSYSMYLPLHNLWNQYISDIVGDLFRYSTAEGKYLPTSSGPLVEARMLKADLHGCILKVTRSKCASLVGLEGIMVKETENTFTIVTQDNALKGKGVTESHNCVVIPKANSVFTIPLHTKVGQVVTLYGSQFCYRGYERATKKFKSKGTIEL